MQESILAYNENLNKNMEETLSTLKKFDSIVNVDFKNEKMNEHLGKINGNVKEGIIKIEKEIKSLSKNLEWSGLNVAFFGETNAGKSTLIQALTVGDGSTIGKGTKDFTKEMKEFRYQDMNLLDLPGIEGNEPKYIGEIKKGIEKAHVVFFVTSSNKEPEEPTIRKIKGFLKDQTNVYSIINVRSRPNKHTVGQGLQNSNLKIVEQRTKSKFQDILGKHYKGNLVVNAHVAFLATKNVKEERFENQRMKMNGYFKDQVNAVEYSKIESVNTLLADLNKNSSKGIVVSNTYKHIGLLESITTKILSNKKGFDIQLSEIEKEIEVANIKSQQEIKGFKDRAFKLISSKMIKMRSEFKEAVETTITLGNSETYLKSKLTESSEKIQEEIQMEVEEYTKLLNKQLQRIYDNLEKQIEFSFKYSNSTNSFYSMKDILINVRYSLKNLMKDLGGLVLNVLATMTVPPLVVVTVISQLTNRVYKYFKIDIKLNKKKSIRKTQEKLNREVNSIEKDYNNSMKKDIEKLEKSILLEQKKIKNYMFNLKKISYGMNEQIQLLMEKKLDVSKGLMEYIEKTKYEYVYIDLMLERVFTIGQKKPERGENLNLKQSFYYPSFNQFLEDYSDRIREGIIYFKPYEEFQKRAVSNMLSKNRVARSYIKGVRRESHGI